MDWQCGLSSQLPRHTHISTRNAGCSLAFSFSLPLSLFISPTSIYQCIAKQLIFSLKPFLPPIHPNLYPYAFSEQTKTLKCPSPHSDVGHPHYLHNAVCALQVPHESIKLRVVCGTDTSCKCKCNHNNNNDRRPSQPMPTCMWTRHLQHQWAAIVANVSYHMSFTLPCVHKSYFCTLPLTFTSWYLRKYVMNELSIYLILSRKYLLPDAVLGSLFNTFGWKYTSRQNLHEKKETRRKEHEVTAWTKVCKRFLAN